MTARSKARPRPSSAGRNWAIAAAVVTGGSTLLYVWLIANESDEQDLGRVAAVVGLFLLATACAIGAVVLRSPDARHVAGAAGTGLLVSLGVLALFSIGLLLLLAAGLLIMAIGAARSERRTTSKARVLLAFAAGAALPWALVLVA
ncbi:MAG TPA: hypothetical protein VH989_00695 [Actinomycetota bacterium]|jgi:hypothetical protein